MRTLSMVIYGLQNLAGSADLSDRGYDRGPVKLIQRSKLPHLHDERSDRSRTVWPHIFDVLHADDRRWHLEPNRIGGLEKHLGHQRDHLVGLEILSFLQDSTTDSQNEAGALRELASGARGEVTAGLAVLLLDAPRAICAGSKAARGRMSTCR